MFPPNDGWWTEIDLWVLAAFTYLRLNGENDSKLSHILQDDILTWAILKDTCTVPSRFEAA